MRKEWTTEFHIIERDMNKRLLFVDIFGISASLGKIISLSVALANVVKLVFIKGWPYHDAAHLEVFMILLMKVPLLSSSFLSKKVNIDSSFQSLLRLVLFLPHRFHHLVVADSFLIDPYLRREELPPHLLLHDLNYNRVSKASRPQKVLIVLLYVWQPGGGEALEENWH